MERGRGKGRRPGGKTGRLKSTITRSLSFTTSPCATAPHGGPNKTTISRGGAGWGEHNTMPLLCFCDPGAFPPEAGPIGGKNIDRNGPLNFPKQISILHMAEICRKKAINTRADGNNKNLLVEKHDIIVFRTAEENVLMDLIYE